MRKFIFFLLVLFFLPLSVSAGNNFVNLAVPFTSEVPSGVWTAPWNNACEEAAIVMINEFYAGNQRALMNKNTAKAQMNLLFAKENEWFGDNKDTSATSTAKIVNDYSSFTAKIVDNPTLDDIKAELAAGRPVITLHYGFGLNNPLIPFRRGGSSYHTMTLVGYDDAKKSFIVNDPGNHKSGLDFYYKYATIMDTLHDFNYQTGKADGPARVLFTAPKQLIKTTGSSRIYLVQDGVKHYIARPAVFKNRNWKWSMVKTVLAETLATFPSGDVIGS